jgi:hypothetical protein
MKKTLLAAVAAMALGSSAQASTFLNFEGIGNFNAVDNFYNGGLGGSLGIQFANGIAVVDADAGGAGQFANEPSGSTIMTFTSGSSVAMNVASGFINDLTFFYTASQPAVVQVFDGLNGTGAVLATVNLVVQHTANGCVGDPGPGLSANCNWTNVVVSFSGVARSALFAGSAQFVGFDDVTVGDFASVSTVPEPATIALAGLGLAVVSLARARRK